MRVLDVDLDFFVHGVAHFMPKGGRLDAGDYPPWNVDDALRFIEERCGVRGKLPGWAVDDHGEIFGGWRGAIERGDLSIPFSVTHVDAHADLGLGDSGYIFLLTELLELEVDARAGRANQSLTDGNWLAFAIGCRWISDLTYVLNEGDGPPGDLMAPMMENFDTGASNIELAAMTDHDLSEALFRRPYEVRRLEPKVPFTWVPWQQFQAEEPFDFICLARSPEFTPPESDALFDAIRAQFIDEILEPPPPPAGRRQSRDW